MPTVRHLVIFVLILLVLRRVTGVPISIVGSVVLTIIVSVIINRLDRRGD